MYAVGLIGGEGLRSGHGRSESPTTPVQFFQGADKPDSGLDGRFLKASTGGPDPERSLRISMLQ